MHIEFARRIPPGLSQRVPRPVKSLALRGFALGKALRRREHGFCPVCGHATYFCYDARNSEDMDCLYCLSSSRNRAVALEVLRFFGQEHRSLNVFAQRNDRDVYLMAAFGALSDALKRSPRVVRSEYYDDTPPGVTRNGVLNQDVRQLTFPDNTFDLVISEAVFEHVPHYRKGFRELWRVLRPGGAHIFNVPYTSDIRTTDRFAEINGEWVPVLPLELHGDRIRGTIPAYTSFGSDLPAILAEEGFETRLCTPSAEESARFQIYDGVTFVSIKREKPEKWTT